MTCPSTFGRPSTSDMSANRRASDPEAQPPKFLAYAFDDVAHPVMAAMTPVELKLCASGREIQFVIRQEYVFQRDLVIRCDRGDRPAAVVHIGHGFEQADSVTVDVDLCNLSVKPIFRSKLAAVVPRE